MPERLFRVRGRVQGVGFRWWTRSLASDLNLTGTVRNESDGSVEIRVSGSEEMLTRFRQALTHGPDGAQVSAVEESLATAVPTSGFEIVR